MYNLMLRGAINISKKIVYISICLLIFASFSGASTFEKNLIQPLETESVNQNYSHTVFAGVAASQVCGPCHNWSHNIYNTYNSGDYDFEYASMIIYDDEGHVLNYKAFDWASNYSVGTYPTTMFDGDYQRITGDNIELLPDTLDTCGNRTVSNITANLTVELLGNATIKVTITIQNNQESQYNGYIRAFITEIISRYNTSLGNPFHFGFLDFAFDENISINPGSIYTDYIIWNGNEHQDNHGDDFGDIKANNIQLILAVYNRSIGYVDETIIAHIPNSPPFKPSDPIPENGTINVSANVDFKWDCNDPDGDELTYNVYLGKTTPPPLIISNLSEPFYDPGLLDFKATYYWKIVADDNRGGSNESSIWNFTTKSNKPPETPGKPFGPIEGASGTELEYVTSTYDPDGDDLYYWFDWGNGNNSGWIGPVPSNEIANASYIWSEGGDFTLKVKAKDIYGAESNWSEKLSIHVVEPILEIGNITGGIFRVNAVINNVGDGEATDVYWNITLSSGLIFFGEKSSCNIKNISHGNNAKIRSKFIFGIGKAKIVVNANVQYGKSDTKTIDAFLLGCYIRIL
jgi:hypothetical protein